MSSTIDLTGDDDILRLDSSGLSQVNVKLRSLDAGLDRNILLSKSAQLFSIDVGRASKNLDRNMYPQTGNAWIESPVMSRHHAQLLIDNGSNKAVYVKDMGSTHGTKLNGNPIVPKKRVQIVDGDVLGFGGTVMAGTQIFRAKAFQVECRWEKHRASPIVLTPSSSGGDTAPRTYSVPSPSASEDEDMQPEIHEKMSDNIERTFLRTGNQSSPLVTKPQLHSNDNNLEVADVLGLRLVGPEATATGHDFANDDPVTSDNDGPEALPIQKSNDVEDHLPSKARRYSLNYDSDDSRSDNESDIVGNSPKDMGTEKDDNAEREPSAAYSPEMPRSPSYSPSSPVYSPQSPAMSPQADLTLVGNKSHQSSFEVRVIDPMFDQSEADWLDHEDGMDVYDDYASDAGEENERDYPSSTSDESRSSVASDISDSESPDEDAAFDEPEQAGHARSQLNQTLAAEDSVDLSSTEKAEDLLDYCLPELNARRNSPSDAAMVKPMQKSSATGRGITPSRCKVIARDDKRDSPEAGPGLHSNDQPQHAHEEDHGHGAAHEHLQHNTHRYTQGPFVMADNLGQTYMNHHPAAGFPFQPSYPMGIAPYFGGDQLVDMEIGLGSNNHLPFAPRAELPRFWRQPEIPAYNPVITNSTTSHQSHYNVPAERPSKLTISHLVNGPHEKTESFIGEACTRSLKRKAGDISTDTAASLSTTRSEAKELHGSEKTSRRGSVPNCQDLSFEQPGPPDVPSGKSSDKYTAANGLGKHNCYAGPQDSLHVFKDESYLTQESTEDSLLNAQTILANRMEDGEPTPKRTKTEHRARGAWVRKAATHMLAGVAGAAGILALLIATVPEETQREASSEY